MIFSKSDATCLPAILWALRIENQGPRRGTEGGRKRSDGQALGSKTWRVAGGRAPARWVAMRRKKNTLVEKSIYVISLECQLKVVRDTWLESFCFCSRLEMEFSKKVPGCLLLCAPPANEPQVLARALLTLSSVLYSYNLTFSTIQRTTIGDISRSRRLIYYCTVHGYFFCPFQKVY